MQADAQEALKTLNLKKVWLPILFGLAITGLLFYRSGKVSRETISLLANPNWTFCLIALLSILLREIGHIYRLRLLSNSTLSWKSCFYIAILWEFATAVTPSVVGGGLVAVFIFSKEGLSLGKSLSYVIVNGIMDNLFFLLAGSCGFFGAYQDFFAMVGELGSSAKAVFFTNYMILLLYTMVIAIGIFVNPKLLKWILMHITSVRVFRRWRRAAYALSKDIILTSHEFKGRHVTFWSQLLLCTVLTWGVRYLFLNCLIAAYSSVSLVEHMAVFGKQVIIWALMLVPVSPGGSGIAELLFQQFFDPMLGDYTVLISLLWRMCTYYLYLTLGIVFLPKWIRRVYGSRTTG